MKDVLKEIEKKSIRERLEYYRGRLKELRDDFEQNGWRAHGLEIQEYIMPSKGRYLSGNSVSTNEGDKKHQKILNGVPGQALRNMAAGMQNGITSPSRP